MAPVIIYSPLYSRSPLRLALFALSLAPITLLETAGAQYVPAQVMCGIDEFIPAA